MGKDFQFRLYAGSGRSPRSLQPLGRGTAVVAIAAEPSSSSDNAFDSVYAHLRFGHNIVLPESDHHPSLLVELSEVAIVSGPVSLDLLLPIGCELVLPKVKLPPMPEVAVNEYHHFGSGEDEVQTPHQPADMLAETQPSGVNQPPDGQLRCCVAAADPRHRPAPLGGRQVVRHAADGVLERHRT